MRRRVQVFFLSVSIEINNEATGRAPADRHEITIQAKVYQQYPDHKEECGDLEK